MKVSLRVPETTTSCSAGAAEGGLTAREGPGGWAHAGAVLKNANQAARGTGNKVGRI